MRLRGTANHKFNGTAIIIGFERDERQPPDGFKPVKFGNQKLEIL